MGRSKQSVRTRKQVTKIFGLIVALIIIFATLKFVTFSSKGILNYDCTDKKSLTIEEAYLD